jgi:Protein of unknown function (DUF2844)
MPISKSLSAQSSAPRGRRDSNHDKSTASLRDYSHNIHLDVELDVCTDSSGRNRTLSVSLLFALALLVNIPPAFATLGEGVASVAADQQALHADLSIDKTDAYTDYVLQLPQDLTVHEFVNTAGVVFEVTWSGKGRRPDMHQLLGSYFEYLNAPVDHARSRSRKVEVTAAQIVIHSEAYARFFKGAAYLPTRLPASFSGPISVPLQSEQGARQ